MGVYVYAVLAAPIASGLGRGLAGEPLRVVFCPPVHAVIGEMDAAPEVSEEALRGHDGAVRRLARRAEALLPVRFGSLCRDEDELRARLAPQSEPLTRALALVRGREQMTLRLYGKAPTEAPAPELVPPDGAGPGTRYLLDRRRALEASQRVAEAEALRPLLSGIVQGERAERHDRPPLVASVHHLVARGQAARYRRAIARGRALVEPLQVQVRGPWPPYAFCPELLA
jgi:hypothetical protein